MYNSNITQTLTSRKMIPNTVFYFCPFFLYCCINIVTAHHKYAWDSSCQEILSGIHSFKSGFHGPHRPALGANHDLEDNHNASDSTPKIPILSSTALEVLSGWHFSLAIVFTFLQLLSLLSISLQLQLLKANDKLLLIDQPLYVKQKAGHFTQYLVCFLSTKVGLITLPTYSKSSLYLHSSKSFCSFPELVIAYVLTYRPHICTMSMGLAFYPFCPQRSLFLPLLQSRALSEAVHLEAAWHWTRLSDFKSWICHLPAVRPWAHFLASLCKQSLTRVMKIKYIIKYEACRTEPGVNYKLSWFAGDWGGPRMQNFQR